MNVTRPWSTPTQAPCVQYGFSEITGTIIDWNMRGSWRHRIRLCQAQDGSRRKIYRPPHYECRRSWTQVLGKSFRRCTINTFLASEEQLASITPCWLPTRSKQKSENKKRKKRKRRESSPPKVSRAKHVFCFWCGFAGNLTK